MMHSIAAAEFISTEGFKLFPFSKDSGNLVHGLIHARSDDGRDHWDSCCVQLPPYIKSELVGEFGPITIEFIQQQNRSWLMAGKSQNILAARYARIKDDDMQALLATKGV